MTEVAIFYSFRRCPYAMRARMAIWSSRYKVELREVLLSNKPKELTDISPKGTVPVLKLPSGEVIDESLDVMKFVLKRNDPDGLLFVYEKKRQEIDWLIELFDSGFKYHLDRYKYSDRYEKADRLEHRDEGVAYLRRLDSMLAGGKDFLMGSQLSFLDIALLPFVRQYRIADPNWFDHDMPLASVKKWLNLFLECGLFKNIMGKHPIWQSPERGFQFP